MESKSCTKVLFKYGLEDLCGCRTMNTVHLDWICNRRLNRPGLFL